MAIRKIMDQHSKNKNRCISCGRRGLPKLGEGRKVKCRFCQCVHTVHFTVHGNVMLTDDNYSDLFKKEEN